MRALRSVPVLLDIARDVEAVAPDAWLVNVTNPLTALCRSVTRETNVKTVGLCNEWVGCSWILSLLFDCGMARHRSDPRRASTTTRSPRRCASTATTTASSACTRSSTIPSAPRPSRSGWIRPTTVGWVKVSPADVLDEARRDREQPRALRALPPLRCARRFRRSSLGRVHARLRAPRQRLRQRLARAPLRHAGPSRATPTTTSSSTRRCATRPTSRACRRASSSRSCSTAWSAASRSAFR